MKYMTKKINPSILEENRIQEWLDSFEEALATGNQQALEQLWLDELFLLVLSTDFCNLHHQFSFSFQIGGREGHGEEGHLLRHRQD